MNLKEIFEYPCNYELLSRKQKSLRRELLLRSDKNFLEKKIAILGGSTTTEIKNLLELFLLRAGIRPEFYESGYNRFYEEAVFDNPALKNFQPDVIIIFTGIRNILNRPELTDTAEDVEKKILSEFGRFKKIWQSLEKNFDAAMIQNNFDFPPEKIFGNLDATSHFGLTRFVNELNKKFAEYAEKNYNFYVHDLNGLAAKIGLENWHNPSEYCAYKFAMNFSAMPRVAKNLSGIVQAVFGLSKKCLVLDLDYTLWGGYIGDDGVDGLQIGHETPEAESFFEFQSYVLRLRRRGVILAVCSKNFEDVAKSGFNHPDSVLKISDFAAFRANWQSKDKNILEIARELNIGTDSMVFIDDNPLERHIVRENLPEVAVPEVVAGDVYSYIRAIEEENYFEPAAISADDLTRNENYSANKKRHELETSAESYENFLRSLEMQAEISPFREIYFDRIAQLTNKTNQFNLTTRRFNLAEIKSMASDPNFLTLYCRLKDKFGDSGLISVVIAEIKSDELNIILWLMSCRVFSRGVELAMINSLVRRAKNLGIKKIVGQYFETKKNKIVAELYKSFGFQKISQTDDSTTWSLDLENFVELENFIEVVEEDL